MCTCCRCCCHCEYKKEAENTREYKRDAERWREYMKARRRAEKRKYLLTRYIEDGGEKDPEKFLRYAEPLHPSEAREIAENERVFNYLYERAKLMVSEENSLLYDNWI